MCARAHDRATACMILAELSTTIDHETWTVQGLKDSIITLYPSLLLILAYFGFED